MFCMPALIVSIWCSNKMYVVGHEIFALIIELRDKTASIQKIFESNDRQWYEWFCWKNIY